MALRVPSHFNFGQIAFAAFIIIKRLIALKVGVRGENRAQDGGG